MQKFLKSAFYFEENRVSKLFTFSSRFFTKTTKKAAKGNVFAAMMGMGVLITYRRVRLFFYGEGNFSVYSYLRIIFVIAFKAEVFKAYGNACCSFLLYKGSA